MALSGVLFDLGDTLVTQEPLVGSASNGLGAAALAALLTDQVEHPPTAEQLAETLGEALPSISINFSTGELISYLIILIS